MRLRLASILVVLACLSPQLISAQSRSQTPAPPPSARPELVLQTGHTGIVVAVAYSPVGGWLASAATDKTVKIWDEATGRELRSLTNTELVASLAISRDGRQLVSASISRVKIWDARTAQELHSQSYGKTGSGSDRRMNSVALSPDGRWVALGAFDGTIQVMEVETGRLRIVRGPTKGDYGNELTVHMVVLSADGRWLASNDSQGTTLWEVATGRNHKFVTYDTSSPVAFSPDGSLACVAGAFAELVEVATGRVLRRFPFPTNDLGSKALAFSLDGRWLASGSSIGKVRVWDVATGNEIRALAGHGLELRAKLGASGQDVLALAFSPDGRWLVSGSRDESIKLWEVATGREMHNLAGRIYRVGSLAISSDGRWLASGNEVSDVSQTARIKLWDSGLGTLTRTLVAGPSVYALAFSSDGRLLASGGNDKWVASRGYHTSASLWEVSTGKEIRTLSAKPVSALAFSPDGRWLVTGNVRGSDIASTKSDGRDLRLWDTATGTEMSNVVGANEFVSAATFSPDGRWLAGGTRNGVKVWDLATWQVRHTLDPRGREYYYNIQSALAFSPDGRWLASGTVTGEVAVWDLATAKGITNFVNPHPSMHKAFLAFSPDGRLLATDGGRAKVKVAELPSGREVHVLVGHTGDIAGVTFSCGGACLVSGSLDGTMRIWDVQGGNLLATLLSLEQKRESVSSGDAAPLQESDWLVVSPDGLFDGSPRALEQILWRFNNNTFDVAPVELFFNEFYYPGLLAEILAGKRPQARTSIENKDRRQPLLQLSRAGDQGLGAQPFTERTVVLKIQVAEGPRDAQRPKGSGVRDVRLFRNGSLVKVWRGDLKLDAQGKAMLEATVPIVAGENRLTAYAFNHDNIKSSDATLVVTGAASLQRKGTAYIVAVGINQYATEALNLKFAVPDADAVVKELGAQQAKLGTYANIEVIPLLDAQATKANFLLALERLAGTKTGALPAGAPAGLARLKPAQPEDAVFIYFAGHGYVAEEKDAKRFYLIMHEFEPVEVAARVPGAVSDTELGEAVDKIDAGLMTLLIDACQSGGALDSPDPRQGPMNSKGLAQLAYDKGMYVLAAAQGNQAALEVNKLGHGLLTHALIGPQEGLTSTADQDKSGNVVVREWLDFATQRVPQLQEEKIEEARKQGRSLTFFKIPNAARATGTATRGDASDGVQRPRVFYRREPEPQPPVIAVTGTRP